MRIQRSDKSHGVGPASPSQPDLATHRVVPEAADSVELSALSQLAAGPPPSRLAEIQANYLAGKYDGDAAEVARRIVDFYLIPVK